MSREVALLVTVYAAAAALIAWAIWAYCRSSYTPGQGGQSYSGYSYGHDAGGTDFVSFTADSHYGGDCGGDAGGGD